MLAVRALQRRVARLEQASKPRPSPFVISFGSFNAFVAIIMPKTEDGTYDKADMLAVMLALRKWETDGTWERAHAA